MDVALPRKQAAAPRRGVIQARLLAPGQHVLWTNLDPDVARWTRTLEKKVSALN